MDKKRLALLEKAYAAEVNAAITNCPLWFMQTKAALAEKLVEEGLLTKCRAKVSGATFEGYGLTHAGRMAYCMTCEDDMPNAEVRGD